MLRRLNVPTMQWNATRHSWSTLLKIALSSEAMKVKRRRLYSNWQLMPMLPSGFTVKMATCSSSAMIWEVGLHMSLVAIVTVVPPSASSVTLDQHKESEKDYVTTESRDSTCDTRNPEDQATLTDHVSNILLCITYSEDVSDLCICYCYHWFICVITFYSNQCCLFVDRNRVSSNCHLFASCESQITLTISLLEPDHDVARASRTAVPWPVSVSVYMILCF